MRTMMRTMRTMRAMTRTMMGTMRTMMGTMMTPCAYLSAQRLVGSGQRLAEPLSVRVAAAGSLPGLQAAHQPLQTLTQLTQVLRGGRTR